MDTGEQAGKKLSKEVKSLREYETHLLVSYKQYLSILERLSKLKPAALVAKVSEMKRERLSRAYTRLRQLAVSCFCQLLERQPHFNYRMNILQTVMSKLPSQEMVIRKRVTDCLFFLVRHTDQSLLDFKVDVLKELQKVLASKSHEHMQSNLLDCLVLHLIIVDEDKAKAIADSTMKSQQLHDQMNKLRRKGKLKAYKEIKGEMLAEVKAADAIGLDLSKAGEYNNEIIKVVLSIYFAVLKRQSNEGVSGTADKGSPLLRSVFLGLPQFTQFINIEIVFDLVNVLREYLTFELEQNPRRVNPYQI